MTANIQLVPKVSTVGVSMDRTKHIGIIGGGGKMGRYFVRVCKGLGHENLSISDDNPAAALALSKQFNVQQRSNIEIARECDIVIVSVPPSKTVGAINEVGHEVREGALFAHFTTVQTPAMEAMAKFSQCDHIGIHIMAAPSDNLRLSNINVILVQNGLHLPWQDYVRQFFSQTEANVCITDSQTHDILSDLVQAKIHLGNFLFGYVLRQARKEYGLELRQIEMFRTPLFLFQELSLGRMLVSNNPDLYADTQMENPCVLKSIEWMQKGLTSYSDIIAKKDKPAFRSMFEKLSAYFGRFHTLWTKVDSDQIISTMKVSYKSHVDEHKRSIKDFYDTELTKVATDSGVLKAFGSDRTVLGTMRPELHKMGQTFLAVGYQINMGNFAEANIFAKELLTLLKRGRSAITGNEVVGKALSKLIGMCEELEKMEAEMLS